MRKSNGDTNTYQEIIFKCPVQRKASILDPLKEKKTKFLLSVGPVLSGTLTPE